MITLLLSLLLNQDVYRVTVSRVEHNLYRIHGRDLYVKTRACYVYAYYEEAIIDTGNREIWFEEGKCDIEEIL